MNKILFCIVLSIAFLEISSIVFASDSTPNNPEYVDLQNYAQELGYQVGTDYKELANDNTIITRRQLTPNKQFSISSSEQTPEQVFIVSFKKVSSDQEIYFLAKITKEGDNLFLTFFDREGGVKIDLTNESVADVWATHHSCNKWDCTKYYILSGAVLGDITLWLKCAGEIAGCIASIPAGGIACPVLLDCALKSMGSNLIKCFSNSCYYYPCKQDCSENNYNDSYVYYCDGPKNKMQHAYQYIYKCPSNIGYGQEGTCILDNQKSGLTSGELVGVCLDYCNNGICTTIQPGSTTTTTTTYTTVPLEDRISELEKKMNEMETRTSLLEVFMDNLISKICSIRYFEDLCKPKCLTPYRCSATCEDDNIPTTCFDRIIHAEYFCKTGVCCESKAVTCPPPNKNIALLDAFCDGSTNTISVLIKNDGTTSITFNSITFYINGTSTGITRSSACSGTNYLTAGSTKTCTLKGIANGFQELRVSGPSNEVGGSVYCS